MAVPVQPYADLEPAPMPIGDDKDEKERASSLTEYVPLGREELSDKIPPNDSYEGESRSWVDSTSAYTSQASTDGIRKPPGRGRRNAS